MIIATTTRTTTLLTCLWLVLLALPCQASAKNKSIIEKAFDGALSGATSFGAELALTAAASGLYLGYCGKEQVVDDVGEFICSVIGETSGDSEKEWRNDVHASLDKIEAQLGEISTGQLAIERSIEHQAEWLRALITELPERARVHDDLANIDSGWKLFLDMFDDVADMTPDQALARIRKTADLLLNNPKYNVDASAVDLRVAITSGHAGKDPMPMLLAKEISNQIRVPMDDKQYWDDADPEDFDIRPYYAQMELALQNWLLRERQAQVMVLFAERVLSSNESSRLSASEFYGKSYFRNQEDQLESFQRAVEWLVLNHSFPRSPFANFLPHGALEVFQRADALQALYLVAPEGEHQSAIWGRVISMGDAPGMKLGVTAPAGDKGEVVEGTQHQIPLLNRKELDWWTASTSDDYDTIHFSDKWRVYRYKIDVKQPTEGEYQLAPSRAGEQWAVLPEKVWLDDSFSAYTNQTTWFGSFTAIARAGGGYALFSGDYHESKTSKVNAYTHKIELGPSTPSAKYFALDGYLSDIDRQRGSMPRIVLGERGETKLVRAPNFGLNTPFQVISESRISLISNKRVKAENPTQKLEIHLLWSEDDLGVSSVGQSAQRVLFSKNDWQLPALTMDRSATYQTSYSLGFGDGGMSNPSQGIKLNQDGTNKTPIEKSIDRQSRQRDSQSVVLGNSGIPVRVSATTYLILPEASEVRRWNMVARGSVQTAYLTRAEN